ncbi:hypothetical protein [Synechococcus sp. 1G10]|uniref:hypothetical protein n=1 Tax=Synechococcus sp. 1G10 TaxID=2025605 RepID=UPI0018EA28E7|nr:hypothetical protein [Synechococcus sp. 1G10]
MPDHSSSPASTASASDAYLSGDQLEDLQAFLKDWLRHQGRTQADLRRALRAESIRMPVLLENLQQLHAQGGLSALADRLCGIEELWQQEEGEPGRGIADGDDPLGQLDLLLEEIRQDRRI